MLTKRSVAGVVIFSILTCGIYAIWWSYAVTKELQQKSGRTGVPAILIAVLVLLVSPVGGALLAMEADEDLNIIRTRGGLPVEDNKILWLILGILLQIVLFPLIQYDINRVSDSGATANQTPHW